MNPLDNIDDVNYESINESSLLIKQFQNLNIHIYETIDELLFNIKDIINLFKLLDVKNIYNIIENLDNEYKKKLNIITPNGNCYDIYFLNETGLYELLFMFNKDLIDQFKKWILKITKEIRITKNYNLHEQLKIKEEQLKIKDEETKLHKEMIKAKEFELQDINHLFMKKLKKINIFI